MVVMGWGWGAAAARVWEFERDLVAGAAMGGACTRWWRRSSAPSCFSRRRTATRRCWAARAGSAGSPTAWRAPSATRACSPSGAATAPPSSGTTPPSPSTSPSRFPPHPETPPPFLFLLFVCSLLSELSIRTLQPHQYCFGLR